MRSSKIDGYFSVALEDLPENGEHGTIKTAIRPRVARLVSRLYGAASAPLRTRILACLVRPLGLLGLAGVSSGAFAGLAYRDGDASAGIPIGDLAGYSSDQIFELARFVEQVSPDAIQQLVGVLADNPVGVSAFGTAVVVLLVRAVKGLRPRSLEPTAQSTACSTPSKADSANGSGLNRTSSGHGSTTALNEMVHRRRDRPGPDPIA